MHFSPKIRTTQNTVKIHKICENTGKTKETTTKTQSKGSSVCLSSSSPPQGLVPIMAVVGLPIVFFVIIYIEVFRLLMVFVLRKTLESNALTSPLGFAFMLLSSPCNRGRALRSLPTALLGPLYGIPLRTAMLYPHLGG